jgi:hypothetical protein
MTGRSWRRYGGAAVLCGLAAIGAVPVHAASSGATNDSFAGYQVSAGKKHITTVREKFVVPTITCRKSLSGVGPAIELDSAVDKKTNTFTVAAVGVGAGCQNKQPVYDAIVQVDGVGHDDFQVAAGDHIKVIITAGKHKTTATLVDGKQTSTYKGAGMVGETAFLGATSLEVSKKQIGLDPFTKIKVRNAEVNGKSLKAAKAVRLTWVNKSTVLAKPSKLSNNGERYTIRFKHSN